MSQRLYIPFEQLFTNLGAIAPGWKICTYETGTTTPKATYSDTGLSVANANPADPLVTSGNQVADANGRLGDMFVGSSNLYKVILKDDLDNTIQTMDPVDSLTFSLNTFNPIPTAFWGTTSGTSTAYTLDSTVDISTVGYQNTQTFIVAFHIACGAAPTMAIDGLTAINLKKYTGIGTKVPLEAGDVQVQRYLATNDGADIVILNPQSMGGFPGDIKMSGSTTANPGWLYCNGAAVSRSTYAALFAAIGTDFGPGNGTTTFNLPDFRGYFPRGWADNGSIDPARTFASTQTDAFQGHFHNLSTNSVDGTAGSGAAYTTQAQNVVRNNLAIAPVTDGTNGTPRTANETRPTNLAIAFYIKT